MSWNYRIVRYAKGDGYGLHEVRYNEDGKPISMGEQPAGFVGKTPEEIRDALVLARGDASRRPILDEPPEWSETDLGEPT